MFQVFGSHMRLEATIMDSSDRLAPLIVATPAKNNYDNKNNSKALSDLPKVMKHITEEKEI